MCGYIGIRGGVLISMYSSVWVGNIVRMQNCKKQCRSCAGEYNMLDKLYEVFGR